MWEIWGDVGKCGEIWGDLGRRAHLPAPRRHRRYETKGDCRTVSPSLRCVVAFEARGCDLKADP